MIILEYMKEDQIDIVNQYINKEREEILMESSNIHFCRPLQRLMEEHVVLRKDMDLFYEITEEIELESGTVLVELFTKLHEQISLFAYKLKAHSKLEEEGLFPLMAPHLGETDQILETMEFEHKKAEEHLQDFLSEAETCGSSIDENDVQWIALHAFRAHATLTQHFAKEEKVLFPLAEKILSIEEKQELERLFHTISS
ncbi:hemerythrin domain-containing protein [Calidifontibacillus erzurumensis]|uniref:Hemerythrin domain-containing protein n=1 Tax=Calidifontibacillus erzurumensis TaxID=2741433 RepID=A0A8J8GJV0_9BACI|nr:hemerythrin domain-containing protein [Calidifontibacillus erzurumensis]NSL53101.1 hemerythrin domain-containing protein [Calidifontibacillus erzurumensis]